MIFYRQLEGAGPSAEPQFGGLALGANDANVFSLAIKKLCRLLIRGQIELLWVWHSNQIRGRARGT